MLRWQIHRYLIQSESCVLYSVIICPQFFGMLEEENRFKFDKGERQFPKTYVPNVIMACIDTNKPVIKDIKIVEKGEMFNGYEEFV